jgi:hypothetical protein
MMTHYFNKFLLTLVLNLFITNLEAQVFPENKGTILTQRQKDRLFL